MRLELDGEVIAEAAKHNGVWFIYIRGRFVGKGVERESVKAVIEHQIRI